jgi:hypothetical protein
LPHNPQRPSASATAAAPEAAAPEAGLTSTIARDHHIGAWIRIRPAVDHEVILPRPTEKTSH